MNLWSHRFSQNMNKKVSGFRPLQYRTEILTIFCSYLGRNDDFINSFWNHLNFSFPADWHTKGSSFAKKVSASDCLEFRIETLLERLNYNEAINLPIELLLSNPHLLIYHETNGIIIFRKEAPTFKVHQRSLIIVTDSF